MCKLPYILFFVKTKHWFYTKRDSIVILRLSVTCNNLYLYPSYYHVVMATTKRGFIFTLFWSGIIVQILSWYSVVQYMIDTTVEYW